MTSYAQKAYSVLDYKRRINLKFCFLYQQFVNASDTFALPLSKKERLRCVAVSC